MTDSLIIAYYDGDSEVQILSNFARTPFELDGYFYESVEGFWQSLKTDDPIMRQKFSSLYAADARQLGRSLAFKTRKYFTYYSRRYVIGSPEHHTLLERAMRAKTGQNGEVVRCLKLSQNRPLSHCLKTPDGRWRPANSPALPASVFERIWDQIRLEVINDKFVPYWDITLPQGINEVVEYESWVIGGNIWMRITKTDIRRSSASRRNPSVMTKTRVSPLKRINPVLNLRNNKDALVSAIYD